MNLPNCLAFVDVETTGMDPRHDRVIELAVIRVENGQVVKTLSTLLDPQNYLAPEITSLTGIRAEDLTAAPSFRNVADELIEILEGSIFVAHHARFDYGFIKSEFNRIGHSLKLRQLCTVRLSRELFPGQPHNLDAIIDRFHLQISARHRAWGDADAIRQYFQLLVANIDNSRLINIIDRLIRHPSIPRHLSQLNMDYLPELPGVYIFYSDSGMPLYIGKSLNIKERVLSHFTANQSDPREMRLSAQVVQIETEVTAGELGALLREAELIKKLQPLYNRRLRHTKHYFSVRIVPQIDGYKGLAILPLSEPDHDTVGIFKNIKPAREFIRQLCHEHQLCEKLCGLEKIRSRCFRSDLDQCKDCSGQESPSKYNLRFDLALCGHHFPSWPFMGPIIINQGAAGYIFDHWKYLGEAKTDVWETSIPAFDLDTFNILKRFLNQTKNHSHIKVISKDLLQPEFPHPKYSP